MAAANRPLSGLGLATELVTYLHETVLFLTNTKVGDNYLTVRLQNRDVAAICVDGQELAIRTSAGEELRAYWGTLRSGLLAVLGMSTLYVLTSMVRSRYSFDHISLEVVVTCTVFMVTGAHLGSQLSRMEEVATSTPVAPATMRQRRHLAEVAMRISSWQPLGTLLFWRESDRFWGACVYLRAHVTWVNNMVSHALALHNAGAPSSVRTLAMALLHDLGGKCIVLVLSTHAFRAVASACAAALAAASTPIPLHPECSPIAWTVACMAETARQLWAKLSTWMMEDLSMTNWDVVAYVLKRGFLQCASAYCVVSLAVHNLRTARSGGVQHFCMDSIMMGKHYVQSIVAQCICYYLGIPVPIMLLMTFAYLYMVGWYPLVSSTRQEHLGMASVMAQAGYTRRAMTFPQWQQLIRASAAVGALRGDALCRCCTRPLSARAPPVTTPINLVADTLSTQGFSRLPPKPWQMHDSIIAVLSCGHAAHATCITTHETRGKVWPIGCPACAEPYTMLPLVLAHDASEATLRQKAIEQTQTAKPTLLASFQMADEQLRLSLVQHWEAQPHVVDAPDPLARSLLWYLALSDHGRTMIDQFLVPPPVGNVAGASTAGDRRDQRSCPESASDRAKNHGSAGASHAVSGIGGVDGQGRSERPSRRRAGSRNARG